VVGQGVVLVAGGLLSDEGNAIGEGQTGMIVGFRGVSAIVALDRCLGDTVEAAPGDYRLRSSSEVSLLGRLFVGRRKD
jgi:hypothetical protein